MRRRNKGNEAGDREWVEEGLGWNTSAPQHGMTSSKKGRVERVDDLRGGSAEQKMGSTSFADTHAQGVVTENVLHLPT